jgi:hypothetical protein
MTRCALSFLAIAAVLALVSVSLGPSAAQGNPYLSALSDLAASPLMAAGGGCGNRACDFTKFRTCYNNPGTHCDRNVRTAAGCATVGC